MWLHALALTTALVSFVEKDLRELVEDTDVIVVGRGAQTSDGYVVEIDEVLKGDVGDRILVDPYRIWDVRERVFSDGDDGIFFLRPDGGSYAEAYPANSLRARVERDRVVTYLHLLRDPSPFVHAPEHQRDPDLVYFVGQTFMDYEVESPDAEWMAKWLRRRFDEDEIERDALPWTVTGDVARSFKRVCESSCDAVSDFVAARLEDSRRFENTGKVPGTFAIRLRLDTPEAVGELTRPEAIRFLRDTLSADDPKLVREAVLALTKLRELDSVGHVVPLLRHRARPVRMAAAAFLGNAGDASAVEPLMYAFQSYDDDGESSDESHLIADAIGALGNTSHVPIAIDAVRDGVPGSGDIAGRLCDASCFEDLLVIAEGGEYGEAWSAMTDLVARSNQNLEKWMTSRTHPLSGDDILRLRTWWEAHKEGFRLQR